MKIKFVSFLILIFLVSTSLAFNRYKYKNPDEPWKEKQLLAPSDLNKIIRNPNSPKPLIFSIGPGAIIPGSINIGPAEKSENLNKLKKQLSKLPKDAKIIIYCGCCPFQKCPNIRPAFKLLNEMGFKNHMLLNLPHNIKIDWIDKGYSVN